MRLILPLLFVCILLSGCKKDKEVVAEQNYVELRATFNNANGVPTLKFQSKDLGSRLQIDSNFGFIPSNNCEKSMACVSLSNVRLVEKGISYEILAENTETFEMVNGTPLRDLDNKLSSNPVNTLDYVLVLDIGKSLGANEATVKQQAADFIDQIAAQHQTKSRVGLVVFSDVIETFKLSSDFTAAKAFIQSRTGGNETKLYQAVDKGLSLLEESNAEAIAMVTFTDGLNNSWSDAQLYQSIDYIKNRLNSPVKGKRVSSYTIGLKGHPTYSPDENVLKDLTQNGGISFIGKNTGELSAAFQRTAVSVLSTYNLTYSRNTSQLAAPIELVFKLQFKSI